MSELGKTGVLRVAGVVSQEVVILQVRGTRVTQGAVKSCILRYWNRLFELLVPSRLLFVRRAAEVLAEYYEVVVLRYKMYQAVVFSKETYKFGRRSIVG